MVRVSRISHPSVFLGMDSYTGILIFAFPYFSYMEQPIKSDIVKCYLVGCEKPPYPGSYWCSRTHQLLEQEQRYGRTPTGERKAPLTVRQMQDRLHMMAEEARNKKTTGGIESSQG